MTEAIAGFVGVIVGGGLTFATEWWFARSRQRGDDGVNARLLLADVSLAGGTFSMIKKADRWLVGTTPINWAMWDTQRRTLATLVRDEQAWAALLDLSMLVENFNSSLAGAAPDAPLNEIQRRTVHEGLEQANQVGRHVVKFVNG